MFTAADFGTSTGQLSPRAFTNPGLANTPRKTTTYDGCCSIDFFSRVLEYSSGEPFNIIELVNDRCPVTTDPTVRFNRVFHNMLNTFTGDDNINLTHFNEYATLFTNNLRQFWNDFSRGGSSLFTEIFNIKTRLMVEDSKYNTAGLASKQCKDILGPLTPTSICMYCGVLAGDRPTIVPILTCEHLLEVLMLFMTIGLAPNKKMYPDEAYNLVRAYLRSCGCYTYACYHCNMVKAQVQLNFSGIFITIRRTTSGIYDFVLNLPAVIEYGRLYFTKLYFAPPKSGQLIATWYIGLGSYITDLVISYLDPVHPTPPPIDSLTGATIAFPLILTKQDKSTYLNYIKTQADEDMDIYPHPTFQIGNINELRDFLHHYYFDMTDYCHQFTPFIRDLEYRFSLHTLVIVNVIPLCNTLIGALNQLIAPPFFSDMYNLLGYGILKVFSRVSVICGNTAMRPINSATVYGGNAKKYNLKGGNITQGDIYKIFNFESTACDNEDEDEDEDEATTQLSSQENMDFIINNILLTFKMGQIQPPNDEGIFNYINAMSELTETDKQYIFNKSRETVNDIDKMAAFNTYIDNQYKKINEYASKTIEENRQAINILRQETETHSLIPHATPPPHYQTPGPPRPPATPPPQYQAHGPPRPPATPPPQYQAHGPQSLTPDEAQAVEYIINTTRQLYHGNDLKQFMDAANSVINTQQISPQHKQYISNLVYELVTRGYGGKKRKNKRKTKRRKQKKHLKRKTRK
jgi:hypothetical protein